MTNCKPKCDVVRNGWNLNRCDFGYRKTDIKKTITKNNDGVVTDMSQNFERFSSLSLWVRTSTPAISTPDGVIYGRAKLIIAFTTSQFKAMQNKVVSDGKSLADIIVRVERDFWITPDINVVSYGSERRLEFNAYIFNVENNEIIPNTAETKKENRKKGDDFYSQDWND